MAKQIGIGATLFLMSTKALALFFFVLFLINIPLLMFYKGGVNHQADDSIKPSLTDYFVQFSLGNVGTAGFTCGEHNFAKFDEQNSWATSSPRVHLSCGYGTLSQFGEMGVVSAPKDKEKKNSRNCKNLLKKPASMSEFFDETCRYSNEENQLFINDSFEKLILTDTVDKKTLITG